jgi:uncharacterized protein (TIGR00369 family)
MYYDAAMPKHEPADPRFAERVRASFARQKLIQLLAGTLERVAPGEVDIRLPFRPELTQQHGFLHAGAVTAIADSACGYAALTLMPAGTAVLTTEFKVNLMAPAAGESFMARARVVKAGKTLTVSIGEVFAVNHGEEKLILLMVATNMTIRDRPDLAD